MKKTTTKIVPNFQYLLWIMHVYMAYIFVSQGDSLCRDFIYTWLEF